jgi:hypothetical protein
VTVLEILTIAHGMLSLHVQESKMEASYTIAGIDVHKKMLAVVVTDVGKEVFRFSVKWREAFHR